MLNSDKRGVVLTENVLFIILNLAFFAIILIFIVVNSGPVVYFEKAYAKQIALTIDSARPGMEINVDISEGAEKGEDWFRGNFRNAVVVSENVVTVKLGEKSSYSYSFFNDVKPSIDVGPDGNVYIVIN